MILQVDSNGYNSVHLISLHRNWAIYAAGAFGASEISAESKRIEFAAVVVRRRLPERQVRAGHQHQGQHGHRQVERRVAEPYGEDPEKTESRTNKYN